LGRQLPKPGLPGWRLHYQESSDIDAATGRGTYLPAKQVANRALFMPTKNESGPITWRIHLAASSADVYRMLVTDDGRSRFWAESAIETDGAIVFQFPNGASWRGRILDSKSDRLFRLEYYGGTVVTFALDSDGASGTILTLTDDGVPGEYKAEVTAGWVSVLLALKAATDFDVDLRNHDPNRTWDQGYADN
jgi:uncharacterized protein YndB with AHSA1/START domain